MARVPSGYAWPSNDEQVSFAFEEFETGLSEIQSELDRAAGDKPKRAPRPRKGFAAHLERVEEVIEPEIPAECEGLVSVHIHSLNHNPASDGTHSQPIFKTVSQSCDKGMKPIGGKPLFSVAFGRSLERTRTVRWFCCNGWERREA